ncbi:Hypothetical predicted protein [Podarcis lilfordi]|uniref:Uncharacterized protein n=1 Tax=Podarcis lilfordi TaxID=74358 RepID=A0AA35LJS0_9SAUR|nr:Hypothetical predicted protein [Podarcis lilfordi]
MGLQPLFSLLQKQRNKNSRLPKAAQSKCIFLSIIHCCRFLLDVSRALTHIASWELTKQLCLRHSELCDVCKTEDLEQKKERCPTRKCTSLWTDTGKGLLCSDISTVEVPLETGTAATWRLQFPAHLKKMTE